MDTPSTTVSSLTLSSRPTLMLRPQDKTPLTSNKLLMSGETDGLITLVQSLTHMVLLKEELFQMDILSTTVSSLTPSLRHTLMLKPLDKLPLMPKKNPMFGEMDLLPTLDQSLTILNFKTQLITIIMLPLSKHYLMNLKKSQINIPLELPGEINKRKKLMPGEEFNGLQLKLILD
jgi:hypothetical protein